MDAANLLSVDVDTLFEHHSVPEIDIVHKKIQSVVENKREELRLMVGYVFTNFTNIKNKRYLFEKFSTANDIVIYYRLQILLWL